MPGSAQGQTKETFENGDESADINDPGWEDLKRLSLDDDCYKAVRRRWKNKAVPDPTVNLSVQNFRMRDCQEGRKEALSNAPPQKVPCNQLFYLKVNALKDKSNSGKDDFLRDHNLKMQSVLRRQKQEEERMNKSFGSYGYDNLSALMTTVRHKYDEERNGLKRDLEEYMLRENEGKMKYNILKKRYTEAAMESETYHKFYYEVRARESESLGNPLHREHDKGEERDMTARQVDDWKDAEKMFKFYESVYGPEEDCM